jgi:pimeloyl-ACP methyl ester carboxylesterase
MMIILPGAITRSANTLLLSCLLLIAGCATKTPVGVDKVSLREAYLHTYANPLNQGIMSDEARYVLNRHFLLQQFESDQTTAIAALHAIALKDDRRDILYTLAEMSYLHGSELADSYRSANQKLASDYFLLSALYVYYFAFDKNRPAVSPQSSSARNAMDMYNYGLWQAFSTGKTDGLSLSSAERKLPFGNLSISLDASQLPWKFEEFEKFLPADKYVPRGVSVRNRTPGAGLPLIGIGIKNDGAVSAPMVPVTAFLRIQGGLAGLDAGTATATLELYTALNNSTVTVEDRVLPLGTDTTTPLAYKMEGSDFFDLNLGAFLGREPNKIPDGLYIKDGYQRGKIPVVLVHGTASSPVWWVEMLNTLTADVQIREKYQFWYFVYTSNKGIVISAADLRDALRAKVTLLDPQGKDVALQQMVVIGHSQGGLLTKLTAVDTGDKLLRAMTGKDIDSLKLKKESKAKIQRLFYVEPLPFVKTVIFMSTPHRGSFQSKKWVRSLLRWLVTLPANIVESSQEYFEYLSDDVKRVMGIDRKTVLTSADGMSPDNPMLKVLADIPLASRVDGHSIIAVETDGDPTLGNDGVVEYKSAHLEGMQSEFIVKSGHSSQLNPLAIDEVRRILVERLPTVAPGNVKLK